MASAAGSATPTARVRSVRVDAVDLAIAAAVWLAGALVFFRDTIFSRLNDVSGNVGDARLLIFLHEHWFRVAHGTDSWLSPSFFHPATRTLGYSDTLVLDQLFYTPLRLLGFDQFASFQLTLIGLNCVGFFGWFVLLRTLFGLPRSWALWSSAVCVFANSQYLTAEHPQLWTSGWIPWLILAAVASIHATSTRGAFGWGLVAGGGTGLVAYSSFYVAWTWMLAGLVFSFAVLGLGGWRRLGRLVAVARSRWTSLVGASIGLVVVLVPFLMTYLPVMRSVGSRHYADAMGLSTRPSDLVNVSGTNYVWGSLARSLVPPRRLTDVEMSVAVTPILLVIAVVSALGAATAMLLRHRWQCRVDHRWAVVSISAAVAMVLMIVLPMKFSWGSAWAVPWNVVPGAHAIRAIGRTVLVATPLAIVVVAAFGASIRQSRESTVAGSRAAPMLIGLSLLVVAEQFNTHQTTQVSRRVELAQLAAVPAPPSGCRSFYLLDSVPSNLWHAEVGAMLISHQVGIPTLNGYSGLAPGGYDLTDVYAPGYAERVLRWAAAHSVTDGLCSYDPTTHQWSPS